MTGSRPRVPDRWEFQLGMSLLSLAAEAQKRRAASSRPRPDPGVALPTGRRPHPPDEGAPWLSQLARERALLQVGVALWLAWRSYRLESRSGLS